MHKRIAMARPDLSGAGLFLQVLQVARMTALGTKNQTMQRTLFTRPSTIICNLLGLILMSPVAHSSSAEPRLIDLRSPAVGVGPDGVLYASWRERKWDDSSYSRVACNALRQALRR